MPNRVSIYQKMRESTDAIRSLLADRGAGALSPKLGFVLGSGLGPVADRIENAVAIPYSQIPHFHGTSIEGHEGRMILGTFANVPMVALQGRFHLYEGYPMDDVVFPTRVLCALGVTTLVLTNAAGGVNTRFRPGDLMVIEDHLNLMGDNPLKGPNIAEMGPRFPDMTHAYHPDCNAVLKRVALELKLPLRTGVYAGVLGPTYETPAEVRMLRALGADAVGMSTVPEAIAACHLGVRVCGLSLITNLAAGLSGGPTALSHDEVVARSRQSVAGITELLLASVPEIMKTESL